MSLPERPLKRAFPGTTRAQTSSFNAGNRYDNVTIEGTSGAVVGNVVHQHFYPSGHDSTDAGKDGQDQAIELKDGFSQPQLDAISNYDHLYTHWLRTEQRLEGTCEWLKKLPEFEAWVTGKTSPIFVCAGSVGCGKSITASAVIDILNKTRVAPEPSVLSYYIDATRPQPTTTMEVLRALIRQITIYYRETHTMMPLILRSDIKAISKSTTMVTTVLPNLITIVQNFLRIHPSCFVVVDGVDAFSESEILVFVNVLRQIWGTHSSSPLGGRLMLFCRETLGRRIRLDSIPNSFVLYIRLRHLKSDIHAYIDRQVDMKQQEQPITKDHGLIATVKSTLRSNSGKMFLWIHLQILSLWDPGLTTCDQDVRDQLKGFPEGLDEIYLRCLRRIDTTNDKRSCEIAPRMFRWLASAQTVLTPDQAREAVSMTPTNLPLQKSQLLSYPVTDYCANLVTFDDCTGMVKFTHSSVKEFLCDADKVPPELRYLSLLNEEDDLWCGKVCLAHAKLHNARNKVVLYRAQEIEPRIASPIIRNILADMLPSSLRRRPSPPKGTPFRMPVTAVSRRQASSVAESTLHKYICQHWLTHNVSIQEDHPHYTDFKELCLTHDPDLQPWSTTQTTDVEHYRRMVMHAVMTGHRPLLTLAQTTLGTKDPSYHSEIFHRFVPGTDSTLLHCAVVLGNANAVQALLDVPGYCGDLADALWTSAATAAMRAQHLEIFELLLDRRNSDKIIPSWTPTLPKLEERARCSLGKASREERLLDLCVIEGNLQAVRTLLLMSSVTDLSGHDLSSAFFLACKHGHQEIGEWLASYGADSSNFSWISGDGPCGIVPLGYAPRRSSLSFALQTGDLKMMRTLLAIRRNRQVQKEDLNLIEILNVFGSRRTDWVEFIAVLKEVGENFIIWSGDGGVLWSLNTLLERVERGSLTYQGLDCLMRLILELFYTRSMQVAAPPRHGHPSGTIRGDLLVMWLQYGADDVLVQVLKAGWIGCRIQRYPACLDAVYGRESSRLLECVLDFAGRCEYCDDDPKSGTNNRDGVPAAKELVKGLLQRHYVEALRPNYLAFNSGLGYAPFVEFLLCSKFEQGGDWLSVGHNRPQSTGLRILRTFRAYEDDREQPRYPLLLWIRCYYQRKGHVAAARALCHELQRAGADGNSALNFPAGYSHHINPPLGGHRWQVSQEIWLAIHGWSFRLNRARCMPLSEGDIQYVARMWKSLRVRVERNRVVTQRINVSASTDSPSRVSVAQYVGGSLDM